MRRKSVIRFCQRLHQFLQTASAELIEDGEVTYAKVEVPKENIDFSSTQGFTQYVSKDRTKGGKPEEWSFGVKDNEGKKVELAYHHSTTEKDKTFLLFVVYSVPEDAEEEVKEED